MEDMITGLCPQCGHTLHIPAELASFSCMYCGARLTKEQLAAEPPAAQEADEDRAAYYDRAVSRLGWCIKNFGGYQKKIMRDVFFEAFETYETGCAPVIQELARGVAPERQTQLLGRAAAVAAPAGMILWTLANVHIGGASLLAWCAGALDPLGRVMGMDGVLLLAFVLGFPANEIVLPIAVMGYLAQGSLGDSLGLAQMHALLTANGWTWTTAVSAVLFFLLHWPCSTTLWTIRRETGSIKWTLLAALLPTAMGMALCTAFTALARALGW